MTESEQRILLERNIKLYNIFKITTKRVFYPLIAVYLVSLGNVTLFQLGLIASIASAVSLIAELPAGLIADRYGSKWFIFLGAILSMISAALYLFEPSFAIGVISAGIFSFSMAFMNGSLQSFMHDTLSALGKKESYSKVMGYGQSYGLLGNVVLISLVPLTYTIHPTIPFILGVIMHGIGAWCIYKMYTPPHIENREHVPLRKIISTLKQGYYGISLRAILVLCVLFGFAGASFRTGLYRSILLTDLGISASLLGIFVALGSLVAALVARRLHYFDRFTLSQIQIINAMFVLLSFLFVGLSYVPLVAIITFVLYDVYMRNQSIIQEAAIFRTFPDIKNKSTVLSLIKTSEYLFGFIVPILLALLVTSLGIQVGHLLFGVVFIVLFFILLRCFKK